MDARTIRLIVVLALFAFSLVRMWRKARSGNRPSSATPPDLPSGAQLPAPTAPVPAPTASPPVTASAPTPDTWLDSGGSAPLAVFAAGVVLIGGSVVMWLALFELPALADMPASWRLAAGLIGNLFLVWLARRIGARLRPRRGPQMTGGNPFPDS